MDKNWDGAVSAPLCCLDSTSCLTFSLTFCLFCCFVLHSTFPFVDRDFQRFSWKCRCLDLHLQNKSCSKLTSLEIGPTWQPHDKIRRGMVESWGNALLFHSMDMVHISGNVWEVPKKLLYPEGCFLAHFFKQTHSTLGIHLLFGDICTVTSKWHQDLTNATAVPMGTRSTKIFSLQENCLKKKLSNPVQQPFVVPPLQAGYDVSQHGEFIALLLNFHLLKAQFELLNPCTADGQHSPGRELRYLAKYNSPVL